MAAAAVAAALAVGACGKRGNPLPPLRPVPARIADLAALRIDDRVELTFTVPNANADQTTPVAIDRVAIFAMTSAAGAVPPPATAILGTDDNLRATLTIRTPDETKAETGAASGPSRPAAAPNPPPVPAAPAADEGKTAAAPGARATLVDPLGTPRAGGPASITYAAVGVTAGGRGRKGPASNTVTVPLGDPPTAPTGLAATSNETTLTVTWDAASAASVLLYEPATSSAADPTAGPHLVTPAPISRPYTEAVEFGRERCFVARAIRTTGAAAVASAPTAPVCTTAVDRYPPPAPEHLQAIQDGAAITLNWSAVDASDLAGYIILRGDAQGAAMQPLMRQPIAATTFVDTAVEPGATYTYSVYAVDRAAVPNVSQQSNRQTVTVR
jgi:hypothetical protein